jgi:DNA-binding NtrC family response regulator
MSAFLIVDGDRNFRDALAIALRLDGHLAMSTGDTEDARAQLAVGWFDCCVADAHLPGADALLEIAAAAGLCAIATGPYPDLLAAAASRHPRAEALAKPFQACDLAERAARSASSRSGGTGTPAAI